jgi:serine/threonine protein kinase
MDPDMSSAEWENVNGQSRRVLGRLVLEGRTYLILDEHRALNRVRYTAFDPKVGSHGALRSIHELPDSKATRQYVQVLQRTSGKNHNLPHIIDCQIRRNRKVVYLVLDWVDGIDLARYIEAMKAGRSNRISATESFRLFRGLAHGVSQLNRLDVVHGDLKPANLILQKDPTRLVMIDFGNAWLVERTVRRALGDGHDEFYAAPELRQLEPLVDFRSDQFSATLIFYELLTFKIPYEALGGRAGEPEYRPRVEALYRAPSELSPDRKILLPLVWEGIDRLVKTGLSLDRDKRYPNRRSWLKDVDAVDLLVRNAQKLTLGDEIIHWFVSAVGNRWKKIQGA